MIILYEKSLLLLSAMSIIVRLHYLWCSPGDIRISNFSIIITIILVTVIIIVSIYNIYYFFMFSTFEGTRKKSINVYRLKEIFVSLN